MLQSFSIGSITVHFYGIFIGLGVVFTYLYSIRKSKKFYLTERNINLSFLISLPLSLFFARIYHVLSYLNYYSSRPLEIFYIWNGGLGIFGLILGAVFGLWLSAKIQKISFKNLLNLIFPSILFAQAFGRIGNFFNQEGFGPNYFPVFILESFLCLISFLAFLFVSKTRKVDHGFAFYLFSYGLIRFFTEFFRTDTWEVNGIRMAWVFSGLMIVCGLYLWQRLYYFNKFLYHRVQTIVRVVHKNQKIQ